MKTLASGAIYEIATDGDFAHCSVANRSDLSAEEGARCAVEIRRILTQQVLVSGSPYRGLFLDVTGAPGAFGPRTREALATVFAAAERSGVRIAVLVGHSAVQRLQFASLSREEAPTRVAVFSRRSSARAWLEGESAS